MAAEFGLSLRWERSSGGVVYVPPQGPTPEQRDSNGTADRLLVWCYDNNVGRYRIRQGEPLIEEYTIESPFEPLALKFVAARDPKTMANFLSRYGLPVAKMDNWVELIGDANEVPEIWVESFRNSVAHFLLHAENPDNDEDRAAYFNNAFRSSSESYALIPQLKSRDDVGRERLSVTPVSLHAFMVMELALIAARGITVTHCEICGAPRITGYTTNRKSNAKTCSAKCRQAASRARRAGHTVNPPPPLFMRESPLSRLSEQLDAWRRSDERNDEARGRTNWAARLLTDAPSPSSGVFLAESKAYYSPITSDQCVSDVLQIDGNPSNE